MSAIFRKATKEQSKLRMALDGPSGSGKTYTGLLFATALAGSEGKVAVIDTERGSASKYADIFEFDVLELTDFHPNNYIEGIKAAEKAGYAVIVIDSLSHAWEGQGGVLDLHEQATTREPGRNSYTAWRTITPIHNGLVDTMLQSKCHVIATMRSKMDYIQVEENGKKRIEKVGMAPIQRQGMEYEFDIVGDMDTAHNMVISKTRCLAIADAVVSKPTAEWFERVKAWLSSGTPAASKPTVLPYNRQNASEWDEPVKPVVNAEPVKQTKEPDKKAVMKVTDMIKDPAELRRFWAWVGNDMALSRADVHEAAKCEHLADYPGTVGELVAAIKAYVKAKSELEDTNEADDEAAREAMNA
ncbi:MAG: ATP-binding protein [bacterium]